MYQKPKPKTPYFIQQLILGLIIAAIAGVVYLFQMYF